MTEIILITGNSSWLHNIVASRRIVYCENPENRKELKHTIQEVYRNGGCIGCIVHCAEYTPKDKFDVYRENVSAFSNVLLFMKRYGIGKLILTSTTDVYSIFQPTPIKESGSISPGSFYGLAKYMTERITSYEVKNFVVLRISSDVNTSRLAEIYSIIIETCVEWNEFHITCNISNNESMFDCTTANKLFSLSKLRYKSLL